MDSKAPEKPLVEFLDSEGRFARVKKADAKFAELLQTQAQEEVDSKWERLQLFTAL